MKNIWSAIFNRAIIDRKTGSLSLIDSMEEVTVNFSKPEELNLEKKNIPVKFTIIGLWADDNINKKREFDYMVEILDPQNQKISEFNNSPAFEEGKKRLRTIVDVNGMGVTTEGDYNVVVKFKQKDESEYKIVSEIPLTIKFLLNTSVESKQ
ncbi:MAG: hypothetical protein PF488_03220 [Patescibacteria group bacterium]|jgi:hypothetical protein|nr:hypothetical protein [Patescibacteria group bacterium]